MKSIIRVGGYLINLDYLVWAEEIGEGRLEILFSRAKGGSELTNATIELTAEEAKEFNQKLEELLEEQK